MKKVEMANDKIMHIEELTQLEKLEIYQDTWPLINFRKLIKRFFIHINMAATRVVKNRIFEYTIILIIAANCMTLTMQDNSQEPTTFDNYSETIFQILYTIEMVLKILSSGFIFNREAYLRDPWNMLDFIIVMTGYFTMLQDLGYLQNESANTTYGEDEGGISLTGFRAFRMLRPLRFVNSIDGLKVLLRSVLSAIPMLKDTILVLSFFFLIFAIGGVNILMGELRRRCVEEETGRVLMTAERDEFICGANMSCPSGFFCGKRILNPNSDVTNFDNIFMGMLVVFQCISLEGWSEVMVLYQIVYSNQIMFFFVPMVYVGSFFLLNLTLAVINNSFNET
jgi:hypothetical protein